MVVGAGKHNSIYLLCHLGQKLPRFTFRQEMLSLPSVSIHLASGPIDFTGHLLFTLTHFHPKFIIKYFQKTVLTLMNRTKDTFIHDCMISKLVLRGVKRKLKKYIKTL